MSQDNLVADVSGENLERTLAIKKRALVFATVLLLIFLVALAVFEKGLNNGLVAQHLMGRTGATKTTIDVRQLPAFFILGAGAGLFGGMLGLGGGVLKVAGMLLLFNLDIFFARAVSLPTMFLATASAAWPYAKKGFPVWKAIRSMLPPALVFVLGGLFLGNHLRGVTLTHIFSFFVLFLGLYTLALVFEDPQEHIIREKFNSSCFQHNDSLARVIGGMHGFICGLLGISGGVISVPMQQLLLDMPLRHAIANTLVVSAVCSGLASVWVIGAGVAQGVFSLTYILFVILCIGLGAILGAQVGVRIGVKSSTMILRLLFVVISFTAGLSLLF